MQQVPRMQQEPRWMKKKRQWKRVQIKYDVEGEAHCGPSKNELNFYENEVVQAQEDKKKAEMAGLAAWIIALVAAGGLAAACFYEKNPRCFSVIGIPRSSRTLNISSHTLRFSLTAESL